MSNWSTRTDAGDLKRQLAAEILHTRSPIEVRAIGGSMLPSIRPGDVLIIENCTASEIRVGDIIRFMQAGRFVIHRVIAVDNDCGKISWITRGDSMTCDDFPVPEAGLLGRVCGIRRQGRCVSPPRHLSKTAHWLGRALKTHGSLQERVLRVRLRLHKRHHPVSGLSKA